MSQFRSTGGLDDAIVTDNDPQFFGVNQRLQLNQLQPGEVRESVNGRMEGFWRPRKNVVSVSPVLTTGGTPLNLPFHILPSPYYKAITAVSYIDDVVTITVVGHGLEIGDAGNLIISGITFTGSDFNGVNAITATTVDKLTFPVSGVTGVALGTTPRITQINVNDAAASEVLASCLFSDPNDSNKEYIMVALETFAKKIELDTYTATTIPYPVGTTVGGNCDMLQCFDKVMLMRNGQQALEWYPNGRAILSASSNATASPNTVVTMRVREHGLTVGASVVVAGLTDGTPPNGTFTVATIVDQDLFTFVASGISTSTTFVTTVATMTDGFTLSPGGAYTQPQTFVTSGNNITVSSGLVSLTITGNLTIFAGDIVVIYETTIPEFTAIVGKQFQVTSASTTNIKFFAPVANISASGSTGQVEFGGRFTEGGGFMHQPGAPWATYFQRRLWVPFYYDQSGTALAPTFTSRKITDEVAASDLLDTTTFDQIANQFRISGGTADHVVAMHGFYDDVLIVFNRNSIHGIYGTQGSLTDTVVKELTSEVGCLARKSVVMQANNMLFLSDDGVYGLTFADEYNLRGTEEPLSKNIQPYIDRINKNLAGESVAIYFNNRYYLAVPLDSVAGNDDARGNNSVLVYNFLNKGWESIDTYGDTRFLIENFVTGSAGVRNNLYAISSNGGLHQMDAFDSSIDRLSVTNDAAVQIAAFTGSIAETTLTVTSVASGSLELNGVVAGRGISANGAQIVAFGTGTGGVGTYIIDPPQQTLTSRNFKLFTSEVETPTINSYITSRGYDFKTLERKRFTDAQIQIQSLVNEEAQYTILFGAEDPDASEEIGTTTQFLGGAILEASDAGESESASIRCRLGGIRGYTGTITLTRDIGSPKVHSIQVSGSITNRQIISQK
jgi:hypothetical protein